MRARLQVFLRAAGGGAERTMTHPYGHFNHRLFLPRVKPGLRATVQSPQIAISMSGHLTAHHFLVVDDNSDSRFLLVKTLVRKFPAAVIDEAQTADHALALALNDPAAIITHRTVDMDGLDLLKRLREQNHRVPILMVSSIDRSNAALEAGANRFMLYDEWLRTGSIVDEMLSPGTELAH